MSDTGSRNLAWADALVGELIACGVRRFFLSPGSRCTALTVAVARHGADAISHFDERGAAYAAIGHARASGEPAALICTSGTAVANYLPAVIEAAQAGLPMLLLTADRPPELRDTGANQAIDQVKIFGDAVRWFFELPCPTEGVELSFGRNTINHAVSRAREQRGPVHINCCFREPFLPEQMPGPPRVDTPVCVYAETTHRLNDSALGELRTLLVQASRPCLLVGELRNESERQAVRDFQARVAWPTLPDITSGLRLGTDQPGFCHYYDLLLANPAFAESLCPDLLLQIGGRMTSKGLAAHLQLRSPQHHVLLSSQPGRRDPEHSVSMRLSADITDLLPQLDLPPVAWMPDGCAVDSLVDDAIAAAGLSEAAVARQLPRLMQPEQALILGASMPIRAVDILGAIDGPRIAVAANRGASGIDGTVATAFGYAQASGRPTVLLLGDLALLHDLNSLDLVSRSSQPIQIIVINNDGGGIFSFLPIAREEAVFEPWFASPHGRNFRGVASTFALSYAHPADCAEFATALAAGTQLIEVSCSRERNVAVHQALRAAISTTT